MVLSACPKSDVSKKTLDDPELVLLAIKLSSKLFQLHDVHVNHTCVHVHDIPEFAMRIDNEILIASNS